MTATPVNITPESPSDGVVYADAVLLTPSEATLGDASETAVNIPVVYGQAIIAVVRLSFNGRATGATTLIALQTDMGDGVWVDLAWIIWTGNQGSATFVLAAGGLGAMNNAVAMIRQSGSVPTPQVSGSNSLPLGARVRFVGFSNFIGGSSSLAGTATYVSATITYKMMHPR